MDEQEKNPGEMNPEISVEETVPQAEDPRQEANGASEQPEEETIAAEKESAEESNPAGEGAEEEPSGTDPEEKEEKPSDDAGAEIKPGMKATPGKIALAVAFVVVLVAALIALVVSSLGGKDAEPAEETETVLPSETQQTEPTEETVEYTIPADGNPDDVTCKGSYTASDADVIASRDTVVATAGEYELTVGQLQVYYWMQVREFLSQYGSYLSYFGLDYTHGLDAQLCPAVEGQTWQQYFLSQALLCWQSYQSMAAEAEKNGVEMPAEYREEMNSLSDELAQSAESSGFDSVDDLVTAMLGGAATYDD